MIGEGLKVADKTVLELIEHKIKSDSNLLHCFKPKKNFFSLDIDSDIEVYSFYPLKNEYDFEYALFKLYCFFNYSIDDIYELLINLSKKYNKSDLKSLSYSDFIRFTESHKFEIRKNVYDKTTDEYKNRLVLKESAESENIKYLVEDYDDTISIIETLNSDMKFICNDEDISAEKRIYYIDKYSKVSIRLNEKRFDLLKKIRAEKL